METQTLRLFQGAGVEIEYMIVDRQSLDVCPWSDRLLRDSGGGVVTELEDGPLGVSNELVKHLVELKTVGPVADFGDIEAIFTGGVGKMNALLEPLGAMLLPSAMHPFMDPRRETVLWDHELREIYAAYDRIFDCRRHGWANLQSLHLNLPFGDNREFGLLHGAVRALLPLIPALAASSPVVDGAPTGYADTRIEAYRTNQSAIPSIAGTVIPEGVFDMKEYVEQILEPMYGDIAPYDPDEILKGEWLNSRGAIARFERNSIEIRLIDTQECPSMDSAVAAAVFFLARGLTEGFFCPPRALRSLSTEMLDSILKKTARSGGETIIDEGEYLSVFGLGGKPRRASMVWRLLIESLMEHYAELRSFRPRLELITEKGTLSARIIEGCRGSSSREDIAGVYRDLARRLARNEAYLP